jgi:hypothetical protein
MKRHASMVIILIPTDADVLTVTDITIRYIYSLLLMLNVTQYRNPKKFLEKFRIFIAEFVVCLCHHDMVSHNVDHVQTVCRYEG